MERLTRGLFRAGVMEINYLSAEKQERQLFHIQVALRSETALVTLLDLR